MKLSAQRRSFAKLSAGLIAGVLICVFVQGNHAQSNGSLIALTQPYSLREDFQVEGLGQWASYPPAQDIGYEPSLSPTSDFSAPGGRSLMRMVKPNRNGFQRFGFIRKVRMTFSSDSRLKFSYRLNSPTPDGTIEVGFAGSDGRRYETKLTAKRNEWNVVDLPISALSGKPGVNVEAVYIVANLQNADADVTYRFMIDDLTISGMREARFEVKTPQTETLEPWPTLISAKSFHAEEAIAIEAIAPGRLASAECSLETPEGHVVKTERLYDDGSHGDKAAGDGIWSNSTLYGFKSSDPKGVWLARVHGSAGDGQAVNTSIRLIVRPSSAANHPRLFFDSTDREKLIARSRDPKLAGLWANLRTTAKTSRTTGDVSAGGNMFELLDSEYLLPSLLGYFDVLNRARARISSNAFDAYLTGDAEARPAAKAALLDVARWKHWEPPWFRAHGQHTYYPAGLLAADVALGYDLLYDDLSEPERQSIRRALIDKSIIPTFREYVVDNRAMTNTSNWIAHTVGGALIAAASIANDLTPTEREGEFEIYVGGLMRKLEDHMAASYLTDGSYGEGISYHEFDAETLGPALFAIQRGFGPDYWKQTHVLEALSYPLYTLTWPVSASPDMGDTHPPAGHGIPPFVYKSKDPVVRWYYSQFDRPSLTKFIFFDDSVQPQAPKLPTSKIFQVKGTAVFRSGWSPDDMVFLFRAGPNFNHHHADQGSFLLTAFGEVLISEAGWSDYYKDPYYATFFTQAVGHNTVLVGDNPESQTIPDTLQFKALNNYPRISDSLTSEFYDGVRSELSSVYQNRLAGYLRSVVFVKPNYFVVFDDLKTNGGPEQFNLLLHLPNRDKIKIENLTASYKGEKASLAVRSFPSTETRLTVNDGRIPYHIFSARTPAETPAQPAYLSFKTVNAAKETQFLTVIAPAKTESGAQTLIRQMSELTGENLRGVRVSRGDKTDLVMFRTGTALQTMRQAEFAADAASLMITKSASSLESFGVQGARSLRRENQILFSSAMPMSVAANFSDTEVDVVGNTATSQRLTLFVGKNPVRVLLDGQELIANTYTFSRVDGTISLTVPTGQHNLKIMLR